MMKLAIHTDSFPASNMGELPEADLVAELMARGDTAALVATDGEALMGYAVFGFDADQIVTVYAARSMGGMLTRAALVGIFGAAQVMGAPVRVHAEKVGRGVAMARAMGAQVVSHARDLDGIPMAIIGA